MPSGHGSHPHRLAELTWRQCEIFSDVSQLPANIVLYTDAGLMMAMRDVHKSRNDAGVLRAFLSDSSPQGTQNWQLSEYWETGSPLEVSDYVDEMADLME